MTNLVNPLDYLDVVKFQANMISQRSSEPFDDLFQEGCIKLIRVSQKYKPISGVNFVPFARKCARNAMLTYVSKQKGRKGCSPKPLSQAVFFSEFKTDEVDSFQCFADWKAVYRSISKECWDAMAVVWNSQWESHPLERQVIELCVLNGMKQYEAAKAIGFSTTTVRTHFRNGLTRLRWAYLFAIGEDSVIQEDWKVGN